MTVRVDSVRMFFALEGAGGRDPDTLEVENLREAVVVVAIVQYVNAGILGGGRDQGVCEGNPVLPKPV
jgi:hypothetical protein